MRRKYFVFDVTQVWYFWGGFQVIWFLEQFKVGFLVYLFLFCYVFLSSDFFFGFWDLVSCRAFFGMQVGFGFRWQRVCWDLQVMLRLQFFLFFVCFQYQVVRQKEMIVFFFWVRFFFGSCDLIRKLGKQKNLVTISVEVMKFWLYSGFVFYVFL